MKNAYRRRESASRLEQLLTGLVRRYAAPEPVIPRVDLVIGIEQEGTWVGKRRSV